MDTLLPGLRHLRPNDHKRTLALRLFSYENDHHGAHHSPFSPPRDSYRRAARTHSPRSAGGNEAQSLSGPREAAADPASGVRGTYVALGHPAPVSTETPLADDVRLPQEWAAPGVPVVSCPCQARPGPWLRVAWRRHTSGTGDIPFSISSLSSRVEPVEPVACPQNPRPWVRNRCVALGRTVGKHDRVRTSRAGPGECAPFLALFPLTRSSAPHPALGQHLGVQ